MIKTCWVKALPKTTIEMKFTIKISRMVKLRFWTARKLFALAGWIINSNIVYHQTLPTSEANQ